MATELTKLMFAGIADICKMLAFSTMPTGVIGILFYNFVMTSYFLGYGGWILAHLPGNLFE